MENLGLDINRIPQVSYSDLRLDLVREAGVFEGAFGKEGGEILWQAFNKNRTNFYAGNRWAQSVTPNGDISLLHAVPQSNRYNIFDIAKNGEIKMSRFTNGQWNWTIEKAGELNKTYKSSKGTIICHFEDETTKTKIVLRQPSMGVKDVERVISYDKNTKQRMISYHKVIDGKRVACDAEGNILKKGIAQTLAHTPAEGKILQSAKMEKALIENLQNIQSAPHKFPSVADIKGMEKIDLYHGSRNFFENYDYTRARTVGGAQYGLGQYFTTKENMAYSYATLDKEAPFIEKNVETNGEKVATQKVVYQGEISGADLNKILVPEKMTDADYDALIKTARSQGKEALAEELTKIKSVAKDRHIDLYQWLRKTESVDLMQSAGINGVYSTERDIYAVYNTSNMNIKVKEAVVLDGTDIPKSLIADKSVIHIQESLAGKPSETHISTSEGSALQKAGTPEGKTVTAVVEKTSSKTASQSTEKAATKTATKTALRAQATNAARKFGATANKTAKSAGQAVTKAAQGTKEALLAANKAYDDTFDAIIKWGDKHAPQWMNKVEEATVQKAAEKFMKTKSGQAIAKQIEKKIGKEAAASIAKKIPILCLGVGAACVYDRLKDGEYLKAVGEGASAIVANVPGLGTLASFGLDGAMLSDDLKVFEHGVIPKDQNSHVAAESTGYDNQLKRMNELIDKQNKEAKSQKEVREAAKKKAAEEAPKMMENIQKLAPWNDTSRT